MPAVPTVSRSAAQRNSIYGRSRTSSSGSTSSASSNSNAGGSVSSVSLSSGKTSSSSHQKSSSPLKKNAAGAVAAAANAASKRLNVTAVPDGKRGAAKGASSMEVLCHGKISARSSLDEEEYHSEILQHMHHMEKEATPCVDLMDAQPELRWYMRPYLVDFIVEIHQTFRLRPETLFLTMNIVDRYVSKRIVYKRHYQLVGCAALLIAAKFEDAKDKVPLVSELAQMCCSAYDESAFVQMEGHVLSTIGWTLGFPTPEAWLRLTCAQQSQAVSSELADVKALNVARFLMEVTLFTRDFIGILPSSLTAGCLLLGRVIAGGNSNERKQAIMRGASASALEVAQKVDAFLIEHSHELSEILIKKYSFSHFNSASNAVVQWYKAFAAQREAQQSALEAANAPTLLPAVSFTSMPTMANLPKSASVSSFTASRQSAEDAHYNDRDDDNVSMRSGSVTPSSVASTPSQMSTDGEDEENDDDDYEGEDACDEDDESDMPVTPLSLNSLHDPLVASNSKENSQSSAQAATTAAKGSAAQQHLHPRDGRRALVLNEQDSNRLMRI